MNDARRARLATLRDRYALEAGSRRQRGARHARLHRRVEPALRRRSTLLQLAHDLVTTAPWLRLLRRCGTVSRTRFGHDVDRAYKSILAEMRRTLD